MTPHQVTLMRRRLVTAFVLCLMAVGAGRAQPAAEDPAVADLFERAAQLRDAGRFRAAAGVYKDIGKEARLKPNLVAGHVGLGDCLFERGKYGAALVAYRQAVAAGATYLPYTHVVEKLRFIAECYAAGQGTFMGWPRYAKAVEVYEDLMRIAPAGDRGPDDALRLGQLQVKAGDRELAVVTFREILRRHPRSSAAPRAHLELGRALLDLADAGDGDGRLKREARLHLERFLERGTDGAARQEAEDLLRSCRAQEAEQLLALGEFYLRPVHARPKAARRYLHDLIQTYPEVDVAEEAEELLAQVQADADEGQDVDSGGSAEAAPERSPEPPVGAPEGMERLQEQERMEKWLRPVEDLGLTREEEDQP